MLDFLLELKNVNDSSEILTYKMCRIRQQDYWQNLSNEQNHFFFANAN